ncbi:MAG: hypothetical protein K5682_08385 [Lachnospiraceae bacterium]|nr:hypothetical protein [Lachnospiraceae bacterium]
MMASTGIIVGISGSNIRNGSTQALQLSADKYANSINSEIEKVNALTKEVTANISELS